MPSDRARPRPAVTSRLRGPYADTRGVNEETLFETILATITMVVIALVLALMLMAAANVHFYPAPTGKKAPAAELTSAPGDHPKKDDVSHS